ncbi:MAG: (Fe-S)-binding protein [Erysipelotrichaceae bacterium]
MLEASIVMVSLGIILGLGLGLAHKFFGVEVDERLEETVELLPGFNCGGCGYAGCQAFAECILKGEVKSLSTCKTAKPAQKQTLAEYLATIKDDNGDDFKVVI